MTEEDFIVRITPSILNIIQVLNMIIDDAEANGLYPKEELYILEEEKSNLFKIYDETTVSEDRMKIWERIGEISQILKKYKTNSNNKSIDALWDILASLEIFYQSFISKEEVEQ